MYKYAWNSWCFLQGSSGESWTIRSMPEHSIFATLPTYLIHYVHLARIVELSSTDSLLVVNSCICIYGEKTLEGSKARVRALW